MPTIHIPEEIWATLLVEHNGDRAEAREDVKRGAGQIAEEYDE